MAETETRRLRSAIPHLRNIKTRLHNKHEREAIDLAIEHIDSRLIDIEAGEHDDPRRG